MDFWRGQHEAGTILVISQWTAVGRGLGGAWEDAERIRTDANQAVLV